VLYANLTPEATYGIVVAAVGGVVLGSIMLAFALGYVS